MHNIYLSRKIINNYPAQFCKINTQIIYTNIYIYIIVSILQEILICLNK